MNIKEEILKKIKTEKYNFLNFKQLLERFNEFNKQDVAVVLNQLIDESELIESNKGQYATPKKLKLIKCKLMGNSRGFAFAICDDLENDIFIPARSLHGAMHNDIVLISKLKDKTEGEVVKIISRGATTIVGTYSCLVGQNFGFVTPDDNRMFKDIFIPKGNAKNAIGGDKVYVSITEFATEKRNSVGKITEVLGKPEEVNAQMLSIIRSYDLFEEFPIAVQKKAEEIATQRIKIQNRLDLRNELIVTIDGEDAKDLDDAISIAKIDDNNYRLGVHIADVSEYVKYNSVLDKEAYKRGTSVYFPDRVLPMLPRELSNGICSLSEGEDRLTLSVIMDINLKGEVTNCKIAESVIRSHNRMTYTDVAKILEGNREITAKYKELKTKFLQMLELSNILLKARKARGSIDFDLPEAQIVLDIAGKVTDILNRQRNDAHRLIESFMIVCNEVVAKHMFKLKSPFIYRVHQQPKTEKLQAFMLFVSRLGISIDWNLQKVNPKLLQDFLHSIDGEVYEQVINKVLLRSMQKAKYLPQNLGHFGLASEFYCHFTSPIRRYPDLAIHRIIKNWLHGGAKQKSFETFVLNASKQSSEREVLATEAERDVDDMKKAEYMKAHIGEKYDAVISGVTPYGVFVELANTVEGLCRLENMPEDDYTNNEEDYALVGRTHKYMLGQKVKVEVVSADEFSREINFAVID
ncbi:MAG: ribonuclease R [Clostridia bacterium]|nr:ribonuclease R [Clostridia bacterium]